MIVGSDGMHSASQMGSIISLCAKGLEEVQIPINLQWIEILFP